MPLIDSGNGRKLECYGAYCIIWPERQALWKSALLQKHWANVGAIFTGNRDEEGVCRWYFPKKPPGKPWPFSWNGLSFLNHFTSLHHMGVFPEQDAFVRWKNKLLMLHVYSNCSIFFSTQVLPF